MQIWIRIQICTPVSERGGCCIRPGGAYHAAMEHLLSPIDLRGKRVRNRVTLTAHTQSYSDNGLHGDRVRDYYAARDARAVEVSPSWWIEDKWGALAAVDNEGELA